MAPDFITTPEQKYKKQISHPCTQPKSSNFQSNLGLEKIGWKKIPPKAGQIVSAARFGKNSEAAALPQLQLRRIRRAELQRTLRPLPPAGRATRPPRPLHLRCHSTSAAEQRRLPAPHRPLCSPGLFLQLSRCSANYRLDSVHLPCNRSSPARRAT